MDILQIVVLAVAQGLTEFLPISSSAHLILIPQIMGWQDQGLSFDVALHIGSLIAVVWYFRIQLLSVLKEWVNSVKTRQINPESRLAWGLGLATLPAAVLGFLASSSGFEEHLRSPFRIAIPLIAYGILLWYADRFSKCERDEYTLSWKDMFIIGCAQSLAILPGTSRSGITMTIALLLGLQRKAAARFSFLLSIPIILLAGSQEGFRLFTHPSHIEWMDLLIGVGVSAFSAYLCIRFFLILLDKIGMLPFVIYRILLGIGLLIWIAN